MKYILTLLLLTCSSLLAQIDSNWTTYGNDAGRTGYVPGTVENLDIQKSWSKTLTSSNSLRAVINNGVVYLIDGSTLRAVKLINGQEIWQTQFNAAHSFNSPTFYNGNLYFQRGNHSSDSQLISVNAKSGKVNWKAPFSAQWEEYKSPLAVNGKIYINGGSYGGIYGFDANTGEQLFFTRLSQFDEWSPVYGNGNVFSWVSGSFTKHDPENGESIDSLSLPWSWHGYSMQITPAIKDGTAYFTNTTTLFAVDIETMSVIWQTDVTNKCTPAVANGKVYAISGSSIKIFNTETGLLENTITAPETLIRDTLIVSDDLIFTSSAAKTFIYDSSSLVLLQELEAGREIAIGLNSLISVEGNEVSAYSLSNAQQVNYAPAGISDEFTAYENENLIIPSISGLLANDYDVNNDSLTAEILYSPVNGRVNINQDGSFTYLPKSNFSGMDIFYYQISDGEKTSEPIKVSVNVIDSSSTYIRIKIFKDGQEVHEGQEISGTVNGTVEIFNAMHQHAQFYKNFRVLHANEHGHMIMNNHFTRTFTLDTSEFFDGENLISVHAHPHNVEGQPYNTEFIVGTFNLSCNNSNPAPNGDTKLPKINIDESLFSVSQSTWPFSSAILNAADNAVSIIDDGEVINFDQSSGSAGKAQVIPHLGGSVLGRFRWNTLTPPFAEDGIVSQVRLINFQKEEAYEARIVFFIQDEVGRANYGYTNISIPAISETDRTNFPLPALDAHIENLSQGDTVIVPDGEDFIVKVKVTNPEPLSNNYKKLTLWVGNRSVSIIDLTDKLNSLNGATEFYVDIPLPASELSKLEAQRSNGQDSTAFAMWLDFTNGNDNNLPASEHIHITSIRTLSRPWPFGPATAHIVSPEENVVNTGGITVNAASFGNLPENSFLWISLDGQQAQQMTSNSITLNNLSRGNHSYTVFIGDSEGTPLQNSEASLTRNFTIINEAPKTNIDTYVSAKNTPLETNSTNSILVNDSDLEGDTLTASLITNTMNGSVSLNNDGTFVYTPDTDFEGIDKFTYQASDGTDNSNISSVIIKIGSSSSSSQWQQYGNGPQHTGYIDGIIENVVVEEAWTQTVSGQAQAPVINNGIVYLIEGSYFGPGKLYALHLNTGQTIWKRNYPQSYSTNPPSYYQGNIYFQRGKYSSSTDTPELISVNALTGETNWKSPFSAQWENYKAPTIVNGKVYINGGSYGGMYGFDADDGSQLFFNSNLAQVSQWTPSYSNGHIYTWLRGKVTKHNEDDGSLVSELIISNSSGSGTVAIDSGIGFVTADNKLFAVDLVNMEVLWERDAFSNINITPLVANNIIYIRSPFNTQEILAYDFSGQLIRTYNVTESLGNQALRANGNKLFAAGTTKAFIFDIETGIIEAEINKTGELVLSNDYLFISASGFLSAYRVSEEAANTDFAPVAINDSFQAFENENLTVSSSILLNDLDENITSNTSVLITDVSNGTLSLNSDGTFTYIPNPDFSGIDTFTYKINDGNSESNTATVTINVIDDASSYIRIKVFKDGQEIKEGDEVSGEITGEIHIHNAMHQHAQFYKNFRTLKSNEHGHMIMSNHFIRTFTLDTSEFFDGENLISAHAHPHNVPGQPYMTDFMFGTFKLNSSNSNPAPNGDTKLPEAVIENDQLTITSNAFMSIGDNAVTILDDEETLNFDQFSGSAGNAQIIPHLGASVLGRFRWNTRTPPFAEDGIIKNVNLINFQQSTETEARIIFFLQDEVGRANYAYANVTIPAITEANRLNTPLPNLDAHIENLSQGDTVIIPDGEDFNVRVKVSNPGSLTSTYRRLNLWVGNRSVKVIDLTEYYNNLTEGETEFFVDIPLPASEITKLEAQRALGQDSTAFAMWLDFTNGNSNNLPTSEHIHLDSIRTLSRPWSYGEPTALILSPEDGFSTTGGFSIDATAFGNLPEGYIAWIKINDEPAQQITGNYGTFDFNSLARGEHTITSFITDSSGSVLSNPEASTSKTITILNEKPQSNFDVYETAENVSLNINEIEGVLSNDSDLEGDSLTATLINDVSNGTLTLNSNGSFTYVPNNGFKGSDSFTYSTHDGTEPSVPTTVRISVTTNGGSMQTFWHTFNKNSEHTNYISGSIDNLQPELAWSLNLLPAATPSIINDGIVYFIQHSYRGRGTVRAVSLKSGIEIWKLRLKEADRFSSLTYADGNIFLQRGNGSDDTQLYSIDADSGKVNWTAPFGNQYDRYLAPVVENGKVYIQGGAGNGIYAFDQQNGEQLFFVTLPSTDNWMPSWYEDHLYTCIRGKLTKHDPETGLEINSITLTSSSYGNLVVIDQGIAFVTENNTLYAVDTSTMTLLWETPAGSSIKPAVSNGLIYVTSPTSYSNTLEAYNYSGELQHTINTPQTVAYTPIITDDKLYVSGSTRTYIYDIFTNELLDTINIGGGAPVLADGYLLLGSSSNLKVFKLHNDAGSGNHTPVVIEDSLKSFEDTTLEVQVSTLISNDFDFDEDPLNISSFTQPVNGTLALANGKFIYTPNLDFSGEDTFTYTINDGELTSSEGTVTIYVQDTDVSYARFFVYDENGEEVKEGKEVSGRITGRIEIYNSIHQHAQFYRNFKVLDVEGSHMVMSQLFFKEFALDTSEFYDGENLLSAHVHPHNISGQPSNTDFTFGTFKLVTSNNNPAPNGDTKLPILDIDESRFSITQTTFPFNSAELNSNSAVQIIDDGNLIDFDQSSSFSEQAQVIPHLGSSVLGRFRWITRTPPFAERSLVDGVRLINFQTSTDKNAKIIFFASDAVGRANYGTAKITIPAISDSDRLSFPLPGMDAHIENIHQGDTIIIPDGESFNVRVKISNPGPYKEHFTKVNLWVGNRSVNIIDITDQLNSLGTETEFTVDIPIPASEIQKMQNSRELGPDSTAFALWVDFPTNNNDSMPASEHVHLDSIRTLSHPWPYGPPTAFIITPQNLHEQEGGTLAVEATSFGQLPDNSKLMIKIDNDEAQEFLSTSFVFNDITRGNHTLTVFIADQNGTPLTNPEATVVRNINIQNVLPESKFDFYSSQTAVSIPASEGVLSNDTDEEGDSLTAELVTGTEHGTLILNSDGSFDYTPDTGFKGLDKFIYRVFDGIGYSSDTTVMINIKGTESPKLNESWHMLGNSAAHTGYIPGIIEDIALLEHWNMEFTATVRKPVVHEGKLFFFVNNTLIALDSETQSILWQQTYPSASSFTRASYADGNLFFQRTNHSSDSQVFSVNAETGATNWSTPFSTQWGRFEPPTIADGKVFINGGYYGGMYGFDQTSGSQLFFVTLPQEDEWTPTYYNGSLYSWVEGELKKHNPETGLTIDSLDIVNDYWAGVMVADRGVGLVKASNQLYAVDLDSMTVLWQKTVNSSRTALPVTSNGLIYIKSADSSSVECYDFSGSLVRKFTPPSSIMTSMAVSDNKLFVSGSSQTFIFDLISGTLDGKIPIGGELTPAGKFIYINQSNKIYSFLIDSIYDVSSEETANGTINIVENEVIHGNYSFINITADPNFQVKSILVNGVVYPAPAGQTNYSFMVNNVTENLNIEAEFEPMPLVTVNSGSGDGQYATGSSITVTADQIEGQYFTHWSGNTSGLDDVNTESTYLTVGNSDITLTANYALIQPKPYMEVIASVTDQWQTVSLPESYISPVIVTTLVNSNSSAPIVTRIDNVTSNSFDIKVQRADGVTSSLGSFDVTYMVVEEGVFNETDHGIQMEAFLHESTKTNFKNSWIGDSVSMINSYTVPVVFGQVMSTNDDEWSTFWAYGSSRTNPVSNGNLNIGKHVAEDTLKTRANETLGCVIVEQGQVELNANIFNFLLGADTVNGVGNGGVNYSGLSGDVAVATLNGLDGGDGGWAVLYENIKPNNGDLRVAVDEDTISDTERSHTTEQLSIATMGPIPVGDPSDDFYTTSVDTLLSVPVEDGVLLNDTSSNSEVEVLNDVSNGSLILNIDGSFSYTPNNGFEGIDQFTYQLTGTNLSATVTLAVKPSNGALRDVYQNLTGMSLDQLRANPIFDTPDITDSMTDFEGPTNWANDYGTRLRARVIVPVSGTYTFYVSGDDNTELLYSNFPHDLEATKIAYINGWTSSRQWTKYASQKSTSINMSAGQVIYLEALSIERSGGDNLAVGWSLNDGGVEVISNKYLMQPIENNLIVTDIGTPAFNSSMTEDNGNFLITASGKDIWSSSDQFGFINKDAIGDIELTAQVQSLENTNSWAKAGVMIRESLNANSKHAMTVVTPANGVSFQRRTGTGSASASTKYAGLTAPQWLKIIRQGDVFSSYYSTGGTVWFPIGSTNISMSENIKVGMALTSHNNSTEADSLISNFSTEKPDSKLSLFKFFLVNSATGQDIRELTHNSTVNLSNDGTNLSIRVEGNGLTGSVVFHIDGTENFVENNAPFALFGKTGGDFNPWNPTAGAYTIMATPFSAVDGAGTAGDSLAISVNVIE